MKYQDLPLWAKKEVNETVTRWFVERGEALYGKLHLIACVSEYIDEHDFRIEYDEEGENPVVEW